MKKVKLIIGIICIAIGVIALSTLSANPESVSALLFGAGFWIVLGLFLVFFDKLFPKKNKTRSASAVPAHTRETQAIQEAPSAPAAPADGERNYDLLEDISGNAVLSYDYEKNLCLQDGVIQSLAKKGGESLIFRQEPENPFDNKAIAVFLGDLKIGYVYRDKIQDMINDYINRGWPIHGYLNKYSLTENKATYKIGFYKPLETFENKVFRLIKTRKKIDDYTTREDNLLSCDVGDVLIVQQDMFHDGIVVCDESYSEIGELPESAADFIDGYKEVVGILESCDADLDDKTTAKVRVYLIK